MLMRYLYLNLIFINVIIIGGIVGCDSMLDRHLEKIVPNTRKSRELRRDPQKLIETNEKWQKRLESLPNTKSMSDEKWKDSVEFIPEVMRKNVVYPEHLERRPLLRSSRDVSIRLL